MSSVGSSNIKQTHGGSACAIGSPLGSPILTKYKYGGSMSGPTNLTKHAFGGSAGVIGPLTLAKHAHGGISACGPSNLTKHACGGSESMIGHSSGHKDIDVGPTTVKSKIVLVGDCTCGKTTLIKRYVTGNFENTIIMAVINWTQFGILCALLTGGNGKDCSTCQKPLHTLGNVACHKDVVAVIRIKVQSDALKDGNWEYHEVEVLKSYKCDDFNNTKPAICMSPLPKVAKVITNPYMGCAGLKLENGESYLFTAFRGLTSMYNIPAAWYSGCNFVKRWPKVVSDEQKIIDQAAKCPKLQE